MQFKSAHNLDFYAAEWPRDPRYTTFKVGTCHGLYGTTNKTYDLIAINNDSPSNGHFTDVLQWFENSCKRDRRDLRVLEIYNKLLYQHLLSKRGFIVEKPMVSVIKKWEQML